MVSLTFHRSMEQHFSFAFTLHIKRLLSLNFHHRMEQYFSFAHILHITKSRSRAPFMSRANLRGSPLSNTSAFAAAWTLRVLILKQSLRRQVRGEKCEQLLAVARLASLASLAIARLARLSRFARHRSPRSLRLPTI